MALQEVTIRGIIFIRMLMAAIGVLCMVLGPYAATQVPDVDGLWDVITLAVLVLPMVLGGVSFVIKALEYVRITEVGVELRSPLWWDQIVRWDEIVDVEIGVDVYTVIPVLRTSGKVVKLRGAASLVDTPRSAARRATDAIRARLGGADA